MLDFDVLKSVKEQQTKEDMELQNSLSTNLSHEEHADLIIESDESWTDVRESLNELDVACRGYFNCKELSSVENIEDDKAFAELFGSVEAWNVSDAVKATLEKFKIFFKKIFTYIGSFVVARVKAATGVVEKWGNTLGDTNTDRAKIDSIKKDYDTKDVSVKNLTTLFNLCSTVYAEYTGRVAKVKALNTITNESEMSIMTEVPEQMEPYTKAKKDVEDQVPGDKNEANKGVDASTGGWFDPGNISALSKSMKSLSNPLLAIKRLQLDCDAIVVSLEKKDNSSDDNIKQLNEQKIKFLRDVSKKVLSGIVGDMVKYTSLAAKKCNTLQGMYEK